MLRACLPRPVAAAARDDTLATVEVAAGFAYPELERDTGYVSLRGQNGYPIEGGSVVTSSGSTGERDGARAPASRFPPRVGTGHGAAEAPRGLLYQWYVNDGGIILDAKIVPPVERGNVPG